ncbi:unnamed protein product [Nippostrongylus brasiliensis]|uniref:Recep_L_domain domain-containing protein n=1 Tax=Nippostrongylus brasiliensis TaxID=27835 RepID=A0A0N4Y4N5_NIPBR|nr:unnamed protein product [Nippostrongylus brasiliensis]
MRIGAIRASLLILTYVMELQGKGAFLPNDAIEELLTQDPSYDNDTSYMVTNCTSPNCQKEEDYEDDETLRTLKFIGTRMSIGILAALSFLTLFTCLYFCFSRGSSKVRIRA